MLLYSVAALCCNDRSSGYSFRMYARILSMTCCKTVISTPFALTSFSNLTIWPSEVFLGFDSESKTPLRFPFLGTPWGTGLVGLVGLVGSAGSTSMDEGPASSPSAPVSTTSSNMYDSPRFKIAFTVMDCSRSSVRCFTFSGSSLARPLTRSLMAAMSSTSCASPPSHPMYKRISPMYNPLIHSGY